MPKESRYGRDAGIAGQDLMSFGEKKLASAESATSKVTAPAPLLELGVRYSAGSCDLTSNCDLLTGSVYQVAVCVCVCVCIPCI